MTTDTVKIGRVTVELSGEDVEAISALNKNHRTGPDPDKFDWIPS